MPLWPFSLPSGGYAVICLLMVMTSCMAANIASAIQLGGVRKEETFGRGWDLINNFFFLRFILFILFFLSLQRLFFGHKNIKS